MHPAPAAPVPEETARVAHAAFPRGNAWIALRDTAGPVYDDACFAPLFALRGRPAAAPPAGRTIGSLADAPLTL